jgi:type I restriction enzyme M protein
MTNGIVQKLWNYCNLLRDDGLSYGDYVEQLTFLLFLKMADEQTRPPYSRSNTIPKDDKGKPLDWNSLKDKDGEELDAHYKHILTELGKKPGMLGMIFRKAQNKIQDPSKLKRLIFDLIGKEQWMSLDADVKGDAYEGLLEKNAADVKANVLFFDRKPASEKPWTTKLWIYDFRTNEHLPSRPIRSSAPIWMIS